jgi:hypothetical protein
MNVHAARHVVVIAGDRVPAADLVSALAARAEAGAIRVTVVCPVTEPAGGFVVYEDARRDAARARLELTLDVVRELVPGATGIVAGAGIEAAARDACAQLAPDELVVCGRIPRRPFGLGGDAMQRLARATGVPVDVVDEAIESQRGVQSVLAIASGSLPGAALVARMSVRARLRACHFTVACPTDAHHPRFLRLANDVMRDAGVDARTHLAHPDPCVAALHAVREHHVDEIIVAVDSAASPKRRARPAWISRATGLPVDAVFEEAA